MAVRVKCNAKDYNLELEQSQATSSGSLHFLANDVILFWVLFLNCSSLFQERYAIPYEEKYRRPPADNNQQNK